MVARLQWLTVGVNSTVTVLRTSSSGPLPGTGVGWTWMSARLTTASWARVRGCSGSEMVAIRSVQKSANGALAYLASFLDAYQIFLARR